jgi:hypothetical protein
MDLGSWVQESMIIELTEHEAKEIVLALRHFFDASQKYLPVSEQASHVYVSVISKLQDGLEMAGVSPWDEPEAFEKET